MKNGVRQSSEATEFVVYSVIVLAATKACISIIFHFLCLFRLKLIRIIQSSRFRLAIISSSRIFLEEIFPRSFYFTAITATAIEKRFRNSHTVWCELYIEKHNQLFFRYAVCNVLLLKVWVKKPSRPTASCALVCKDNGKMSLLNIYIYESTVTSKAKRWTLREDVCGKRQMLYARGGRFLGGRRRRLRLGGSAGEREAKHHYTFT